MHALRPATYHYSYRPTNIDLLFLDSVALGGKFQISFVPGFRTPDRQFGITFKSTCKSTGQRTTQFGRHPISNDRTPKAKNRSHNRLSPSLTATFMCGQDNPPKKTRKKSPQKKPKRQEKKDTVKTNFPKKEKK